MDFLDSNLNVIKNSKTYLYDRLNECDLSTLIDDSMMVNSIVTKDNNQALIVKKDDKVVRLNSGYCPTLEAEKWVNQFSFQNLSIVVCMFGLGNGIFAREIIKQLGERDILLIIEPSINIFMHTLQNYDISDILLEGRVSISIEGVNQAEYTTLLNQCVTWVNVASQIKCAHPFYDVVFPESYKSFLDTLKSTEIRIFVNKNTESHWGKTMVKNEIDNLKYLRNCNIISEFIDDIPLDVPAIIVSAGPSLDKNIQELKKAKGKAFIISTDTALKYLLSNNIIPDFVVTIDANKSLMHFTKIDDIPLMCLTVSNPAVLKVHNGKKIFFSIDEYISALLDSMHKKRINYNIGGSVATAAFSICVSLGFKRIILIGQDLSYSGEISHAGGLNYNAHIESEGEFTYVEDIYGKLVKTRFDWYTYLLWFQDAIEAYPCIDVIDATEGGAKIKGTRIMTLSDTIEQYCIRDIDFKKIVDEKEPTFNQDELITVVKYFKQSFLDLNTIESKSKEAIDICNRLIKAVEQNKIGSYANQDLASKLSKINSVIKKKNIYILINDYISETTTKELDTMNQFSDNIKNDQLKTYIKAREVYKAILQASQELPARLQQSVKDLD